MPDVKRVSPPQETCSATSKHTLHCNADSTARQSAATVSLGLSQQHWEISMILPIERLGALRPSLKVSTRNRNTAKRRGLGCVKFHGIP